MKIFGMGMILVWTTSGTCAAQPFDEGPLDEGRFPAAVSLQRPGGETHCLKRKKHTGREAGGFNNRDCLLEFLFAVEHRLVAGIPVLEAQNEAVVDRRRDIIHWWTAEMRSRVAAFPPNSELDATFVKELLLSLDVLGNDQPSLSNINGEMGPVLPGREKAFAVMYDDFLKTSGEINGAMAELSLDTGVVPTDTMNAMPMFDDQTLAPSLPEMAMTPLEREYAATFQDLVNPHGCKEDDTRPECLTPLLQRDPRYDMQPPWQVQMQPPERGDVPLEGALHVFKETQASRKARAKALENNTTNATRPQANGTHLQSVVSFAMGSMLAGSESPWTPKWTPKETALGQNKFCRLEEKDVRKARLAAKKVRLDAVISNMASSGEQSSRVIQFNSSSPELAIGSDATHDMAVNFHADWCSHSVSLMENWERFAAEVSDQILVAVVDVEDSPQLLERFHVDKLPFLIFLPKNKLVQDETRHPHMGARDVPTLLNWLGREMSEVDRDMNNAIVLPTQRHELVSEDAPASEEQQTRSPSVPLRGEGR